VGFKRRVLYAPLRPRDLRIGNWLYLRLSAPIPEGATVTVENPDKTLWAPDRRYTARVDLLRFSPVIHINQIGYLPDYPKKAMVGYYLGSLGELDLAGMSPPRFRLVESRTGTTVYEGRLTPRPDKGWTYSTPPYQHVLEADFTAFRTPGEYRL